jgi:hypothetical protein
MVKRSIDEIILDFEATASNFDKRWRAESPTMVALFRRAAHDLMGVTTPTQHAYNVACNALHHWRSEAERLGQIVGEQPRSIGVQKMGNLGNLVMGIAGSTINDKPEVKPSSDDDNLPGTDMKEWIKRRKGAPVVTPGVPAPGTEDTTELVGVKPADVVAVVDVVDIVDTADKLCEFNRMFSSATITELQEKLDVCADAARLLNLIIECKPDLSPAEQLLLRLKREVFLAQQDAIQSLLNPRTNIKFRIVPNSHIRIEITFGGVEYAFT